MCGYALLILQYIYRPKDIGQPKANIAAAFINSRIPGVQVTP